MAHENTREKAPHRLFANRYGQVYRMTSYILNSNYYIYKKVEISNHSKNGAKSEKPYE
jgi:hypothetical protein